MRTIAPGQKEFIDSFLLDTYHSFSEAEQLVLDENEEQAEAAIRQRQTESLTQLRTSEELHYSLKNWNWDDGELIPRQIIHHPRCDAGTALMAYWMLDPDFFSQYQSAAQVPDWATKNYALLQEVQAALLAGRFALSAIRFEPATYAAATDMANPLIPAKFKQASAGEEFEDLTAF